jgi:hypothetical protein
MIDTSVVRVHQQSVTAKKGGGGIEVWVALEAVSPRKSTRSSTRKVAAPLWRARRRWPSARQDAQARAPISASVVAKVLELTWSEPQGEATTHWTYRRHGHFAARRSVHVGAALPATSSRPNLRTIQRPKFVEFESVGR